MAMQSSAPFYEQIPIEPLRHIRTEEQLAFIVDLVKTEFRPEERLLEIGCGLGEVIAALPGYDITGIERCGRLAANCACPLEQVVVADALATGLSIAAFDGVYMVWAVLNEFYADEDVVSVLREARRLLRPGGHGLIDMPHIDEAYLRHYGVTVDNGRVTLHVGGLPIDQKVITPDALGLFYHTAGIEVFSTVIDRNSPWPYPRIISTFTV